MDGYRGYRFTLFSLFVGKRRLLERWQGVVFIVVYLMYISFAFFKAFHREVIF
jgi:hypothetical protein